MCRTEDGLYSNFRYFQINLSGVLVSVSNGHML